MIRFIVLLCILFIAESGYAQYEKDICNEYGVVGCMDGWGTGGQLVYSSLDKNGGFYTTPGNSMPFWVASYYVDQMKIDTSSATSVYFDLVDGPGRLDGTMHIPSINGYAYIDDWKFSVAGNYKVEMRIIGTVLDTLNITVVSQLDMCSGAPSGECSNSGGDSTLLFRSSIVSVDDVYPISAGLVSKLTGNLDSGWVGTAAIKKISGSGNMLGTNFIYGNQWATFVDLRFDQEGDYELELKLDGNRGVFTQVFDIEVVAATATNELQINTIDVFPNPAQNSISMEIPQDETDLTVFSVDGRQLIKQVALAKGQFNLEVSNLAAGNYILVLNSNQTPIGETVFTKMK